MSRAPHHLARRPLTVLGGLLVAALAVAVVVGATVGDGWSPADGPDGGQSRPVSGGRIDVPEGQVLFGVHDDPVAAAEAGPFAERFGRTPAVAGVFASFPFSEAGLERLGQAADDARAAGTHLLLTLEPHDGLDAVDDHALEDLTSRLTALNDDGIGVIVRFGHEMNGAWYPWAQRPGDYVAAFRRVADAVHAAPASETMWAPNEGFGYPFADRATDELEPGDLAALDTVGDGRVTQADDPYEPYYPGEDHVDWVGLTLYHFGDEPPWDENVVPPEGRFLDRVRGNDPGADGEGTAVPDFHDRYVRDRGHRFAIAETAALYLPDGRGGASEADVTAGWAAQLFGPAVRDQLPGLELVMWFEYVKPERDVPADLVAWAATHDDATRDAFAEQLPDWLTFADD